MVDSAHKRNFCIIAHIDHGKSTLADRFIETARLVTSRGPAQTQILDNMDIERERGITIKSQAVTVPYTAKDGDLYELNLVDTPGHVDFSYEVSRAISSCEGALLLIDATQGVEAQTLANLYMAMDHDLEIIPVINKIDLASADIDSCLHQIDHDLGLDPDMAQKVSAKTGEGVPDLYEAIVKYIPAPKDDSDKPLKALIFDSHYDPYRGVIVHFRIFEGSISEGQEIMFMNSRAVYKVEEVGVFQLDLVRTKTLRSGDVGYFIAGIKTIADIRVGDTVTLASRPAESPCDGFKEVKPVVFSSIYPVDTNDYEELLDAIERLKLNDASLVYEKDSSVALGQGFRCGFLGMLHMEVIQERLEREFNLDLVTTLPSVIYHVYKSDGTMVKVDNPHNYPDPGTIDHAEEPYVKVSIIAPQDYVGNIMPMCQERRGEFKDMQYLDTHLVELHYQMPLNEIIYDFFDTLKANTKGYASLDYELSGYRTSDLVKVDLLLNGDGVDALSFIAHKDKAYPRARRLCEKLKDNIPRQLFEVPIQAAIGGRIIARETVKAMRKDVLAKCYGGDITRKKKLLEKQKEGKKKMRNLGTVQVPTEAFMAVLKLDSD